MSIIGCAAAVVLVAEFDLYSGVHSPDIITSAMVGALLGAVYAVLRPIVRIVTAPFALLSLGLLYIAVDALLLWAAAAYFEGYTFDSFVWVLAASVTVNVVRHVFRALAK